MFRPAQRCCAVPDPRRSHRAKLGRCAPRPWSPALTAVDMLPHLLASRGSAAFWGAHAARQPPTAAAATARAPLPPAAYRVSAPCSRPSPVARRRRRLSTAAATAAFWIKMAPRRPSCPATSSSAHASCPPVRHFFYAIRYMSPAILSSNTRLNPHPHPPPPRFKRCVLSAWSHPP